MEMPGRRSSYTLLSQIPDDHLQPPPPSSKLSTFPAAGAGQHMYYESHSGDRLIQQSRMGTGGTGTGTGTGTTFSTSIGLQRQSSGSSFGESSLSAGDYFGAAAGGSDPDAFGGGGGGGGDLLRLKASDGGGSFSKSWAQQTEESYQLQLALALRLSSEAACADDPNFLDPVPDESRLRSSGASTSAEAMSHRFWANGCLSYFDKVPDGFYLVHGIDSYVWTVCTDLQESGRIPSLESLKAIDFSVEPSVEVILIDRRSDASLKELQNRITSVSGNCITTKEVVDHLAKLVFNRMGGAASTGEDEIVPLWKECSDELKDCLGSVVLPMGSLSVGLCRHRALLFKVLADSIDLPCRIAKGCKYCKRDDASSCLVRFGLDREFLVDLIGDPGCLYEPDSLLNGPSSISISSPLRFPRFRQAEPTIDFRSLAKQYFSDCESLNIVFDDPSTGDGDTGDATYPKKSDRSFVDVNCNVRSPSNSNNIPQLPPPPKISQPKGHDRDPQLPSAYNVTNVVNVANVVKDGHLKNTQQVGHRDDLAFNALADLRMGTTNDRRYIEGGGQLVSSNPSREITFDVEDLDIPWSDLILKERIGAGSFGTVHRADWNGSDVAVKILMEQDLHGERFTEFLREVAIMRRLRHPNIVLFMGAVTQPPNLSIVTEYLSRGSLYRLLHKPGAKEVLDERRRLSMAYDVAKGMNYLHRRNPPIVHRDLKSPNLLVDKKYTVKVCDFGLSRFKANTFLSSKSAAGTVSFIEDKYIWAQWL